jgi:hypothetical protein
MTLELFIVDSLQPLCLVNLPSFRGLLEAYYWARSLTKGAIITSSDTLRTNLRLRAESVRASLRSIVQGQYVAVTCDFWTSAATQSYASLVAHFIDDEWKLQCRTLECSHMEEDKNAVNVAAKIEAMRRSYGIDDAHIVAVVTDNDATNNLAGTQWETGLGAPTISSIWSSAPQQENHMATAQKTLAVFLHSFGGADPSSDISPAAPKQRQTSMRSRRNSPPTLHCPSFKTFRRVGAAPT